MLLRLHLDVAALDVAAPRVAVVGAPDEFDGEAVPGDLFARAARLTLVEHLNDELALQSAQLPGLRPVGALELGRREALDRTRA